jgi:hypothetical protein
VGVAEAAVDGGASVSEVVGVGVAAGPDGAPPVVVDGVAVGFAVVVDFAVAEGRGVGDGVGCAQRRAISFSCSTVTRAASTLATSMPAVTWAW